MRRNATRCNAGCTYIMTQRGLCIYIYVCMYVCMYMYIYIYIYMYVCIWPGCLFIYIQTNRNCVHVTRSPSCDSIYIFKLHGLRDRDLLTLALLLHVICIYIYIYVYIYVYIYNKVLYIHTYIYNTTSITWCTCMYVCMYVCAHVTLLLLVVQ